MLPDVHKCCNAILGAIRRPAVRACFRQVDEFHAFPYVCSAPPTSGAALSPAVGSSNHLSKHFAHSCSCSLRTTCSRHSRSDKCFNFSTSASISCLGFVAKSASENAGGLASAIARTSITKKSSLPGCSFFRQPSHSSGHSISRSTIVVNSAVTYRFNRDPQTCRQADEVTSNPEYMAAQTGQQVQRDCA